MIQLKNGLRGDVKTLDLIPIRVPYKPKGPQWEDIYDDKWSALHKACLDLSQELLSDDDFIFAIGGEVFPYLKKIIKS